MQNGVALLVAFFTVLLPLKFASLTGLPETSALFPSDAFSWVIITWPVTLFPICSGMVLLLTLLVFPPQINRQPTAFVAAGLWLLLGLVGYVGAINASVRDFVEMQLIHGFGIGAYAATVFLILSNRPEWRSKFLILLTATVLLVALLGWEQRLFSFEDTRRFVMEQQRVTGVALAGDFMARVMDNRIYSTFTSCNNLAGFLLLMMPLVFYYAWQLGKRIEPPTAGRVVFLAMALLAMAVPLYMTGSRAAFAVLFVLFGVLLLAFPVERRIRIFVASAIVLALLAGALVIQFAGRGFWSMFARLDYQRASLLIFAKNPLFGTGWGDFFHDYMLIKIFPGKEAPHDPHCMFMAYLAQCGIIGGISCFLALFWPLWAAWRRILRSTDKFYTKIEFWIFAGVAGCVIHSQVDTNMQVPAIMCYLAALQVTLLISKAEPEKQKNRLALRIIFVIVAGWSGIFGVLDGYKLFRAEKSFAELQDLTSPQGKTAEEYYQTTPQQVKNSLEQTITLKPYSPFPWQTAGDFMFSRGIYDVAERYYLKMLELAPLRASAWHRMHRICRVTGREDAAAEYLQKAQQLFPNNPDYEESWVIPVK